MILSNNPRTYMDIAIYTHEGEFRILNNTPIIYTRTITYITNCEIIYKKYMYRWAGPSSTHTSKLRLTLMRD